MINQFQGEYRFLSNFWPAKVIFNGITFPTVEHAYQAAKTTDKEEQLKIAKLPLPDQAKRAGRKVKMQPGFDKIKLKIMEDLVRQKFQNHKQLKEKLLATGDAVLVEGNWWGDTYWGVCRGRGENHLGRILMKIRSELKKENN